jgi:hypothetical protein
MLPVLLQLQNLFCVWGKQDSILGQNIAIFGSRKQPVGQGCKICQCRLIYLKTFLKLIFWNWITLTWTRFACTITLQFVISKVPPGRSWIWLWPNTFLCIEKYQMYMTFSWLTKDYYCSVNTILKLVWTHGIKWTFTGL